MHDSKVLVVVLDGVGAPNLNSCVSQGVAGGVLSAEPFVQGNAVNAAYMPTFIRLCTTHPYRTLRANGKSVGLPSDEDMGNSEVGHNALGAGRVFAQGAKLVNESFETKEMFSSDGWKQTIERPELLNGKNSLHLCGLLSDGNVHSHINHLFQLILGAQNVGVKRVFLHLLLDGRDVGPCTAELYEEQLSRFLNDVNLKGSQDFQCAVASGGGRTFTTMDRYDSDWSIVERGYNAHVCGEGRSFASLADALVAFRAEGKNADQDLPPFVIAKDGKPVGLVNDGDSFVFFNFRGDRRIST
jgi:2,3-bisphosphoglycerate-independent phosphoglycerate mutase